MKIRKSFIALISIASFCLIPCGAQAANNVAKVGDVEYSTLQEAINQAQNITVVLIDDVTESVTIAQDKVITLDLGNYTITNVADKHTITNEGTLTITGNGTIDNVSHKKGALVNKGTVTLKSGTLTRSKEAGSSPTNSGGNSWYVVDNNGGSFIMEGGTIVNTSLYSSAVRNLEASFTMKGGNITNGFIALKNDDNGVIKMTGGTVSTTAAGGSAIQNWGNLTMTGGTLNAVSNAAALSTWSWSSAYDPVVTVISDDAILNGDVIMDYSGATATSAEMPSLTINGGTIKGNIEDRASSTIIVNAGTITGEISSAENGQIEIAPADYSKVESALKKVESLDEKLYTQESWAKLKKAVDAVTYDKTILEQDLVDSYAKAINEALDNLKLVADKNIENPSTADSILLYIIFGIISVCGLAFAGFRLTRQTN